MERGTESRTHRLGEEAQPQKPHACPRRWPFVEVVVTPYLSLSTLAPLIRSGSREMIKFKVPPSGAVRDVSPATFLSLFSLKLRCEVTGDVALHFLPLLHCGLMPVVLFPTAGSHCACSLSRDGRAPFLLRAARSRTSQTRRIQRTSRVSTDRRTSVLSHAQNGHKRPNVRGTFGNSPVFAVACRIWLAPSTVEHDVLGWWVHREGEPLLM